MPVARSSGLAAAARVGAAAAPVPPVQTESDPDDDQHRPVKFTAVLDQHTVTLFERVTYAMRGVGRLAGGRYPSRADVLRAAIALIDDDPELVERVAERVRHDLTSRRPRR